VPPRTPPSLPPVFWSKAAPAARQRDSEKESMSMPTGLKLFDLFLIASAVIILVFKFAS
jgi:hypothetical protein